MLNSYRSSLFIMPLKSRTSPFFKPFVTKKSLVLLAAMLVVISCTKDNPYNRMDHTEVKGRLLDACCDNTRQYIDGSSSRQTNMLLDRVILITAWDQFQGLVKA